MSDKTLVTKLYAIAEHLDTHFARECGLSREFCDTVNAENARNAERLRAIVDRHLARMDNA